MAVQGSLDQPPIEMRQSREKTGWATIGAVVIGGLSVLDIHRKHDLSSWAGAIICGLLALIGIARLSSLAKLVVDQDGIRITDLFHTRAIPWKDITSIQAARYNWSTFVCVVAAPGFRGGGPLRAFYRAVYGSDFFLPVGWEISPTELANLLNDAKTRWSSLA